MEKIVVKTLTKSYDIITGSGLFSDVRKYIKIDKQKIFIISDSNVAPLYLQTLSKNFDGNTVSSFIIPAGEKSKNLTIVQKIYNKLNRSKISKSDLIIALGGGVVGDITGFAAATYLRGISYIQIPTTLLAQVDSSIGGKCGVNLKFGKNLAGTIYQPEYVICDYDVLNTLPAFEFKNGLAEVVKCGAISDSSILNDVEKNDLNKIIIKSITVKKRIVEIDEFEKNERMLLNFGHTFGHAIEVLGKYKRFSHGQAVAIGMVEAVKLGIKLKITPIACLDKLVSILQKYDLPTVCPYSLEQMLEFLKSDKKIRNGMLNFVLLKDFGFAKISPVSVEQLIKLSEG